GGEYAYHSTSIDCADAANDTSVASAATTAKYQRPISFSLGSARDAMHRGGTARCTSHGAIRCGSGRVRQLRYDRREVRINFSGAQAPPARRQHGWSDLSLARAARQLPVRSHEVAGVTLGVALQVILVLGLGLPEISRRRHFGDHLAGPDAGGIDVGDGVLGDRALLRRGGEYRRAIGTAAVIALPVRRRRVMDLEEELQQFAVAQPRRIEHDLDRFGMAAMVPVGCIGHVAAAVAGPRGEHAVHAPDQVLHAPETAA